MTAPAVWRPLYPFESHFLELRGRRLHYLDEGRGDTLLLVHGNPTWSFYWRNLILALRDRFRLVAVDHMGCGLSDKPADYDYCLTTHQQNLLALIRRLDLRNLTVVVHDWGGPIGLGAALAELDRVRRLVIFNTGAFPPPFVPWRIRVCRTPVLGSLAMRGLNAFARAALWMAVERRAALSAAERSGLIAPYDSWRNRVAIDGFVRDIPLTRRHRTWHVLEELERGLPRLGQLPTQFIWGMRDWCFRPLCLERMLPAFPTARVQRCDTAGHYVVEEARELVEQTVEQFLQDVPINGQP